MCKDQRHMDCALLGLRAARCAWLAISFAAISMVVVLVGTEMCRSDISDSTCFNEIRDDLPACHLFRLQCALSGGVFAALVLVFPLLLAISCMWITTRNRASPNEVRAAPVAAEGGGPELPDASCGQRV